MSKIILGLSIIILVVTNSFANNSVKGLNVLITSNDAQTQMMGMVLSSMTLKKGKEVNIVLCSEAGNLALKNSQSKILKPQDKSPKMVLEALIKDGAKVQVCPLFLPNINKTEADLLENITIAKPPVVTDKLLNKNYHTLNF